MTGDDELSHRAAAIWFAGALSGFAIAILGGQGVLHPAVIPLGALVQLVCSVRVAADALQSEAMDEFKEQKREIGETLREEFKP